jgi:hypothetical protein
MVMSKFLQQLWAFIAVFAACGTVTHYSRAEDVVKDFPAASPESVGVDSKPLVELSK